MATISKDIIDRVRETTDIVDIISEYVDLKQKGPNLFGLVLSIMKKLLRLALRSKNRYIIVLVAI